MTKGFHSSDSDRSGLVSSYCQTLHLAGCFPLELGGSLEGIDIAFETYGKLNSQKSNVILVCHAITGDSHLAKHHNEDIVGWWDSLVGDHKYIDTKKYFVICSNILGSCRGTTGPHSINPQTEKPYGKDFPRITIGDMVKAQKFFLEALKIKSLFCVIGGSLGGFQVLQWATHYPQMVKNCVLLASSAVLNSQALAFDIIGRNAIIRDPYYYQGQYYDKKKKPDVGLAIARMLGHITYLSKEAMEKKFESDRLQPKDISTDFEKIFSVGSYLAYQGDKFIERFDANSYITLSLAMDNFCLGKNKEELQKVLVKASCRWLVISFTSDWLFPAAQSKQIVESLLYLGKPISYCNIPSDCGHDAFLLKNELEDYGGAIQSFLKSSLQFAKPTPKTKPTTKGTSIFFQDRIDFQTIAKFIPKKASLLDLGCEDGELLAFFNAKGHQAIGIELDYQQVKLGLQKGLQIIHSDLNNGLQSFCDRQFSFAIVSQTLQSIHNVEYLLKEVVRVSHKAIVSFPNFAFLPLRKMLYFEGKAPKSKGWYDYEWYNTPNCRFPSILDFEELCYQMNITISAKIFLNSETKEIITKNANRDADNAIFVVEKNNL